MESVTVQYLAVEPAGLVLNAFRHHGIGHPIFRILLLPPDSVLNAFRHHGIGHRYACCNCCNTIGVLNAFRHHGIGHPSNAIVPSRS